ncbi:hypothetical protein Tco_0417717 [Tanacetum coccineum]
MSMTIQSSVKDKILVTSSKTSKCEIRYHPGKANGVADALSRKAIWSRSTDTLGDIMRACVIDFGGSYHSSIRCTPFEALYGRKLVLTKEKLKAARDRQKSNTDKGRKLLEFKVGDWVMLKVSPWKGVIHFGKKGKLALRYVGPFQILEGIGPAAYSVDKTLRLVEEPIEIGDYKGVYVCVYVDYVGVGTQSIERDRLIGIGVTPLCCNDIHEVSPRASALAGCDNPYGGYALQVPMSNYGPAHNGSMYPSGLFADSTGCVTPFVRWIEDYPLPDGLKMPFHVGSYNGKGDPDNYLHLFEAKKVAINGASGDHKEGFDSFSKEFSWDNNKGKKKNRDRFSPYNKSNHGLFTNLSKSPMEILATEKVAKAFEKPPRMVESRRSCDMSKYCHFHEDHGHETNQCRELRHQIEEAVKSGQLAHLVKGIKKGKAKASDTQLGE